MRIGTGPKTGGDVEEGCKSAKRKNPTFILIIVLWVTLVNILLLILRLIEIGKKRDDCSMQLLRRQGRIEEKRKSVCNATDLSKPLVIVVVLLLRCLRHKKAPQLLLECSHPNLTLETRFRSIS